MIKLLQILKNVISIKVCPSVCKLIIKNVKDKNPRNHFVRTTPLHLAATRSHLEVCKLIIEFIENKNSQNKWNGTPLHEAAGYGHLQVCKLIIENIEDKNPKNNLGDTPLHLAAMKFAN